MPLDSYPTNSWFYNTVSDEFTIGSIAVTFDLVNGQPSPSLPDASAFTYRMYMAAGDEMRFGIWLGPPKLYVSQGYTEPIQDGGLLSEGYDFPDLYNTI